MAASHDIGPHQEMWRNFVKLMVSATIAVATALILMAVLLN